MIKLCIPEDQLEHVASIDALPAWPAGAPAPREREIVYTDPRTPWSVTLVVHEITRDGVDTEVWLKYLGPMRKRRARCAGKR